MNLNWEVFVATHARTMLAAALRVLGNESEAEEVAQDVFLKIYQTLDFTALHTQPALVRTMATCHALDRLRRRKSYEPWDDGLPNRRSQLPEEQAMANELDRQLQAALTKLAPRESEVFCLFHYEQCDVDEIGVLLGISNNAVSKALSLARSKLSRSLGVYSSNPTVPPASRL
jgi:RNA polymerase sigma-70 factor, ECF subfamily